MMSDHQGRENLIHQWGTPHPVAVETEGTPDFLDALSPTLITAPAAAPTAAVPPSIYSCSYLPSACSHPGHTTQIISG
eukprot:10379405-Ditylum_brightwellii.AAC.2